MRGVSQKYESNKNRAFLLRDRMTFYELLNGIQGDSRWGRIYIVNTGSQENNKTILYMRVFPIQARLHPIICSELSLRARSCFRSGVWKILFRIICPVQRGRGRYAFI